MEPDTTSPTRLMARRSGARGPAAPPPPAQTLAGRYRIQEVIGRGGMSTVYRATDTVLRRSVAVKVLLAALAQSDPSHIARFEREAQAVAALQHPAVVKIFDTGVDDGRHFIVMEHVAGRSLDAVLRGGRALDPKEAGRIAARVADALAAAHAAGILHRDVKPANVMLTPDGEVKVLDFGIARTLEGVTLTQTASAIGTAAYMPPERARGQPGDERSDVYALGCLLYAMLAGSPPFVAPDSLAVLHQQVHDEPRPPRARDAAISPALEALILSMLAKDPAQRPQTAAAVAARLRELPARGLAQPTRRMPGSAAAAAGVGAGPATVATAAYGARARRRGRTVLAVGLLALLLAVVALASGGGQPRRSSSLSSTTSHHRFTGSWREPARTTPVISIPAPAGPAAPKPGPQPPGHAKPGHGPRGPDGKGPPGQRDKAAKH